MWWRLFNNRLDELHGYYVLDQLYTFLFYFKAQVVAMLKRPLERSKSTNKMFQRQLIWYGAILYLRSKLHKRHQKNIPKGEWCFFKTW